MSSIEKKVRERLRELLFETDAAQPALLTAFSGGADSTALLHIISSLPLRIGAAYVNHRLRDEQELSEERALVRRSAADAGAEFFELEAGSGEIEELARSRGRGIEEAARKIRYDLLEQCRSDHGFDWILTAHHADDLAETMIMRFFKGSGIAGLQGIRSRSGRVLRPMLGVTRAEILFWVEERGIVCAWDSTNDKADFERNRVRQELLPVVERLYPGYSGTLAQSARKMQYAGEFLSHTVKTGEFASGISLDVFNALSAYERMELLFKMWADICGPDEQLPFGVIAELVEQGVGRSGKTLFQYKGALCYTADGALFFVRQVVSGAENYYLKTVEDTSIELFSGVRLDVSRTQQIERDSLCVPSSVIEPPLVVRSHIEGDVIEAKSGRLAVSKLFSDWKVPVPSRWMIPVLEDRSGIVGVLGRSFGYRDRLSRRYLRDPEYTGKQCTAFRIIRD